MLIKQRYRKCVKCGIIGGQFYTRKVKLSTSRTKHYISNDCWTCAKEDSKQRYRRLAANPKWMLAKRKANAQQRIKHKKKIKLASHKYYFKNRDKLKQKHHDYYIKNRDKILKKTKLYKAQHKKKPKPKQPHIWNEMETQRIRDIIHRNT